jgi:hypothetical protein
MNEIEQVPLGHVLAVVNQYPDLCHTRQYGIEALLRYVSQLPLHGYQFGPMFTTIQQTLLHQHPALRQLYLPNSFWREPNSIRMWCWLDEQEQRHGATLPVRVMDDRDWQRCGWRQAPRAYDREGPVSVDYWKPELRFL